MGPKGFTSRVLDYNKRPGDEYRFHMRNPDGRDHWQQGVVCEIVPPERLVLTYYWADANGNQTRPETLLTILLDDLGGKTKLTLHQAVFESTTVRDAHNGGWSSSFDRLADYLATV
jgi:uncharacterized protein YndB with AHSA1/START domain